MILNEEIYNIGQLRIERLIEDIQNEKINTYEGIDKLVGEIRRIFELHKFRILIIKSTRVDFLLMGILLDKKIVEKLTQKITTSIVLNKPFYFDRRDLIDSEFTLLIDAAALFNKYPIKFSPGEITAIILHELGHLINLNNFIDDFLKKFKEFVERRKIVGGLTKLLQNVPLLKYFVRFFLLNWYYRRFIIQEENYISQKAADSLVIEYGYGKEMIIALDKMKRLVEYLKFRSYEDIHMRISNIEDIVKNELAKTTDPTHRRYLEDLL